MTRAWLIGFVRALDGTDRPVLWPTPADRVLCRHQVLASKGLAATKAAKHEHRLECGGKFRQYEWQKAARG